MTLGPHSIFGAIPQMQAQLMIGMVQVAVVLRVRKGEHVLLLEALCLLNLQTVGFLVHLRLVQGLPRRLLEL